MILLELIIDSLMFSGSYQFYVVTYEGGSKETGARRICCNGSILVDPNLRVSETEELPLDSIVMLTVLTKLLGMS